MKRMKSVQSAYYAQHIQPAADTMSYQVLFDKQTSLQETVYKSVQTDISSGAQFYISNAVGTAWKVSR